MRQLAILGALFAAATAQKTYQNTQFVIPADLPVEEPGVGFAAQAEGVPQHKVRDDLKPVKINKAALPKTDANPRPVHPVQLLGARQPQPVPAPVPVPAPALPQPATVALPAFPGFPGFPGMPAFTLPTHTFPPHSTLAPFTFPTFAPHPALPGFPQLPGLVAPTFAQAAAPAQAPAVPSPPAVARPAVIELPGLPGSAPVPQVSDYDLPEEALKIQPVMSVITKAQPKPTPAATTLKPTQAPVAPPVPQHQQWQQRPAPQPYQGQIYSQQGQQQFAQQTVPGQFVPQQPQAPVQYLQFNQQPYPGQFAQAPQVPQNQAQPYPGQFAQTPQVQQPTQNQGLPTFVQGQPQHVPQVPQNQAQPYFVQHQQQPLPQVPVQVQPQQTQVRPSQGQFVQQPPVAHNVVPQAAGIQQIQVRPEIVKNIDSSANRRQLLHTQRELSVPRPEVVSMTSEVDAATVKPGQWFAENYNLSECRANLEGIGKKFKSKFPSYLQKGGKDAALAELVEQRLVECDRKYQTRHWEQVDILLSKISMSKSEIDECRSGLIQERISCENLLNYSCQFSARSYQFKLVPARITIQEARQAENGAEKCKKIVQLVKKRLGQ